MIRANCREKFTAEDFTFIAETLGRDSRNRLALADLLADVEARDLVLDDEQLFQRVVARSSLTRISPYLYFYVLTRRVLLEFKLDDRNMADYVASLLAEFSSSKRMHTISGEHNREYHYLADMMIDYANAASSYEAFLLRSHLGNYALFMSGLFPDYLYRKATYGRKAPGIDYYEEMGSSSYRWASQHRMASKYRLVEILANLAQYFRHVRVALNRLTDEYIHLDEKPDRMDKMLRQIFFGSTGPDPFEAGRA